MACRVMGWARWQTSGYFDGNPTHSHPLDPPNVRCMTARLIPGRPFNDGATRAMPTKIIPSGEAAGPLGATAPRSRVGNLLQTNGTCISAFHRLKRLPTHLGEESCDLRPPCSDSLHLPQIPCPDRTTGCVPMRRPLRLRDASSLATRMPDQISNDACSFAMATSMACRNKARATGVAQPVRWYTAL